MNIVKKILNVFGVLISIVLSLLLAAVLVTAPVVSAATSFLRADTLRKVVGSVDFSALLDEMAGAAEGTDAESEMLLELMNTELVEEMIGLYIEDALAVLEGSGVEPKLTEEAVRGLIDEHADELVPALKGMMGTEMVVPDEELEKMARELFMEKSGEILEMLPTLESVGISPDNPYVQGLLFLRGGAVLTAVLVAAAVISVLILLFRFVRFKGFMWLGVVYMISAVLVLFTGLGTRSIGLTIMTSFVPGIGSVATSVVSTFAAGLYKGAGVLAVLAVVFIAVFVIGRKLLRKRAVQNN